VVTRTRPQALVGRGAVVLPVPFGTEREQQRLHGTLNATFYPDRGASVQTTAPLELRGPFARDGAPLHYLRNVTTGILGGDRYDVSLRAEAGVNLQIASSSATKAFESRACRAETRTHLEALPGARLAYGPHALILQEGASLQARTVALVHEGASLLLAEVLSFGRTAGGERLRFDTYDYELVVQDADGAPLYEERYVLQPDESLQGSIAGYGALVCVYALGAGATPLEALREVCGVAYSGASALPNDAGVVLKALVPTLSAGVAVCNRAIFALDS
jgi:urease accessory protein UreH